MKSAWIKNLDENQRLTNINNATLAIKLYESIRYGNDYGLGFDAALDEVLKQMGLEK